MKKLLYIVTILGICLGMSSCWKEEIPEAGKARHQIENLKVTPGDEEVTLSWTIPEKWNPTDFMIRYDDVNSQEQKVLTGGKTEYTISGLVNDHKYTFEIQALYDEALSGVVSGAGTPKTSRISIATLNVSTDPDMEKFEQYILLTWEKPSELVEGYTLTYYSEMDSDNVQTVQLDKNAVEHKITGVNNENNYIINLVANYPKGPSEAVQTKVRFVIPYFVSRTYAALGQTITFQFNREKYATAENVSWVMPDGSVMNGDNVEYVVSSTGKKQVVLSASINGETIEWPAIELNLREWVLMATEFDDNGKSYQGFKGSYPVFSPDGKTVYNITFNALTALYAYDVETGEQKWSYVPSTKAAGYNPPTVNPVTGDIYFGTTAASQFYCVTPDGQLKWSFKEAGNLKSTAPAVSADGKKVYILDASGQLFSIDAETGTQIWKQSYGAGAGGSMIINGSEILIATQNVKGIRFVNESDGNLVAGTSVIETSKTPTDISGIAVSDDKKVAYVPLKGGGLVAIDLTTHQVINENIFAGNNVYAPVVASNGYVVAASKDSKVYGLTADLKEVVWTVDKTNINASNVFNYSHMCADTQGRVYVTCGQGSNTTLIINAADGSIAQSFDYSSSANQKQMGGNNFLDGVIYFNFVGGGSENGAFGGKFVGGERKFWGGPGGDICGSCCLQSPLL